MKKYTNLISIISLFVISIILFGCGKTQFTKETHKRELEFTRQFEMLTCEKPYGKLCVETEDEEEARKVEAFVDNCFKISGAETGDDKCTLYFLTSFPAAELTMADQDNFVFSLDDVINNDGSTSFERLLTHVAGCDMWISYGLSGAGTEVNNEELKEYYSIEENRAQLSLSGVRFIKDFQEEEEYEKVKQTAISVIKYAKKKGYKNINSISENKTEIINGWLESIGVDYSIEESYEDKVKFFVGPESEKLDYILIDNLVLYRNGSPYTDHNTKDINDLEYHFSYIADDLKGVRDFIISNNILDSETVNRRIVCEWNETNRLGTSFAHPDGDKILLQAWQSLPHEYTHIYFTTLGRTNHEFLNEGIAEYLGAYLNSTCERMAYSSYLNDERYSEDPGCILIKASKIDISENIDLMAMNRVLLKDKDFVEKHCYPLFNEDGWTYEESGVFVGYLIENYSVDEFMKIFTCEGRSNEENEAELQKYVDEWRESLNN